MARYAVAFDTETHLIRPGLLAPPLVCGSAATVDPSSFILGERLGGLLIAGELLDKASTRETFEALLGGDGFVIAGANIAFDLLVMAVHAARQGRDLMPAIFAALDRGAIYDLQIAEALDAVAEGCLGKDPRTGGPLVNPETGRRGRYALATVVDLVLGRTDAKENDEWRMRYAELDGIPIDQWPESARVYPVDDARNTLEVALAQAGHLPRASGHKWGEGDACLWCGKTSKELYQGGTVAIAPPCRAVRQSRNLHDLANQVGTAWAMHLGAAWGFRVDQSAVDIIERDALEGRSEAEEPFIEAGLLKRNRDGSTSKDTSAIARRVALAYGADPARPCAACKGSRKVLSPKAKLVRCPTCRGKPANAKEIQKAHDDNACEALDAIREGRDPVFVSVPAPITCITCAGEGKVPDAKSMINCTACAATGFDLSAATDIPLTPTGRVAAGRDPLNESADEILIDLADHFEGAKTLDVYVPYWRRAREPIAGHGPTCPRPANAKEACTCPGPYRDLPLTLFPNVLLETGRTSYGDVVQLLPRKPGHWLDVSKSTDPFWSTSTLKRDARGRVWIPSLRECVTARPGMVFSSEDYEAGELVTHAQSCLWIVGYSHLADALLAGKKVHNLLGAQMLGMSYEEFQRRVKEVVCKDARQAAKPGNFGFPGGMGPVKLVQTQRKQGPDTPHPRGPTMIHDEDGNEVRGYKGLRFCILMDGADACGTEKLTGWRDRPIAPTCRRCIECAVRLKERHWLEVWPENRIYFDYVGDCVEYGQEITERHLELWPHLADFFAPGRLAPGEIMQHVSGRIRQVTGGEVTESPFCKAANGFFQGLLADIAKSALRRISRECYDRTVRVPDMAHENSERSRYAGGPSPLWGSRPILFAHDEIISEHPEAVAHDAAMRVSEIMVEEMRWYCPDLAAACRAEPTLMRRWYKGASPRWVRGGDKPADVDDRLIPWEPKAAA